MPRRPHSGGLLPPERRFDVLWAGQAVSQFGDYLAFFSVPLLIVHLVNLPGAASSGDLGKWYAIDAFPAIVLGLLSGVLIDRVRFRWLMIASDLGRALMFGWLAFRFHLLPDAGSREGIATIFVAAFVIGTLSSTFNNALYTLVPRLVSGSALASANSRLAASQNLAFALGPAAAGILVTRLGFWSTFAINASTFLISAVALLVVGPTPLRRPSGPKTKIAEDFVNGVRYVWSERRLRTTTIAAAGANLVIGFVESTLVLTATRVAGASQGQVAVMYSALGFGAIAGSLVAPTVVRLVGLGKALVVGMVTFGLGLTLFANIPFGWLGVAQISVGFAGLQILNVPLITIRQQFTPPIMLGRVMSATRAVGWASLPVGALLGTTVADTFGIFDQVARIAPLLMVMIGLLLIPTVVWRNTNAAAARAFEKLHA